MRSLLLLLLLPTLCFSQPILSEGRVLPLSVYADSWLYDAYGDNSIQHEHRDLLPFPVNSAKEIIWSLTILGHKPWDDFPLFYIKKQKAYFSYHQLQDLGYEHPKLWEYENFGLMQRDLATPLAQSTWGMKLLPTKKDLGVWLSINSIPLIERNISPYPDEFWEQIRALYQQLPSNLTENYGRAAAIEKQIEELLSHNYQTIAGKLFRSGSQSALSLPSQAQLTAEKLYYQVPWIELCLALYGLSLIFLIFRPKLGLVFLGSAFLLHTLLLALRCYILGRPPVSNMFETVLYVPWIAVILSFILWPLFKQKGILTISALIAFLFLLLLKIIYPRHGLDNVQPVLNSQYWLIIHVLMVVGSYGAFALSATIAHYYLIRRLFSPPSEEKNWILQSLYVGVALLISGTVLGGIWAAQSWGRFWDWDPKESWAFISSCLYLIVIHAYRFGKISDIGLAFGSLIGFQAITFTWYGVNYILGVGLHSYGFGSGGELYYAAFLLCEFLFALTMLYFLKKREKFS